MATIRKRKHKYQAQVRRAGFPTITKSFHMLKDAQEWSRQMEIQIDRDELTQDRSVLKETTLANLVARYLREVVPSKKSHEVETIILKAFLKHAICKKRLSDLRSSDFASYRDEKLKTIQPNSLKRQLAPLQHMFEIARTEWNLPIKENPLLHVRLDYVDCPSSYDLGLVS